MTPLPIPLPDNLLREIRKNRLILGVALLCIGIAAYFLVFERVAKVHTLRASAGDPTGRRAELLRILAEEGRAHSLDLKLEATDGSEESLRMVAQGKLDLALVQGGLEQTNGVQQVFPIIDEPLHLLVRPGLEDGGLGVLRGKRLNLSTAESGTRLLATETLAFAGMQSGRDFVDESHSGSALEAMKAEDLPDGIFIVSSLPSPLATMLIRTHGYLLKPLPFGSALGIRDYAISSSIIPAFSYSVVPPVPPTDMPTVSTKMKLVANPSVPREAVYAVIDSLLESDYSRRAVIPVLDAAMIGQANEYPLHDGARRYLARTQPLLRSEVIDNIESMRSFFVSVAIALFLLWRWYDKRAAIGFEKYLNEVTRIERRMLELEMRPVLPLDDLMEIRHALSSLKSEALEKFAEGKLKGEELMSSFLTHVTDVRNHLNALILHERVRLEREARTAPKDGAANMDRERMNELWDRAIRDTDEQRD